MATATTEMERSGIEVAVLGLMPESFRSCGDSHTSMQRQRNRSSLARWLGLSVHVATATTEMERSGIEVAVLGLMPESFRSCGDSHTSMQRQRNRSSLACRLNLSFQPHRLPYLYQISI